MTTHRTHPGRTTTVAAIATAALAVVTACTGPDAAGTGPTTPAAPTATPPTSTPSAPTPTPTGTSGAEQCGGVTIDQSAAVTSAHDLLVEAPLEHVWAVHTDVERWAGWQDAIQTIERLDDGPLATGSQFRWTTPVPQSQLSPADSLTITSSVQQLEPQRCVLWEGPAVGESVRIERGVHLWTFTEVEGGTLVHTEESWDAEMLDVLEGSQAEAAEQMLGGGLQVWLTALKTEAEATA